MRYNLIESSQLKDYLITDDGLLDGGEGLERWQEAIDKLGSSHEGRERAQLLGEGQQHLILVVDGVGQEWDQLGPGALHTQCQSNGGELLDGVQAKLSKKTNAHLRFS